jgi:hypothetical protein
MKHRDDSTARQRELRRFGLVMAAAFAVLGGLGLWRDRAFGPYFLAAAAVFLVLGLALPRALSPVERAWMAFARVMATVMTYVILVVTFFVVITPLGLVLRLFGKDTLRRKWSGRHESFWIEIDAEGPASRPEKPY